MARDAVVERAHPFFLVFGTYVRRCVLVATEARVARKVVVSVASRARRVVGAVEQEEPVVVEGGGRPVLGRVALVAGAAKPPNPNHQSPLQNAR